MNRRLACSLVVLIVIAPRYAWPADVDRAYRRLARTISFELANETAAWGALVRPEHLARCKEAGFTAIRFPVSWGKHTSPVAPYRIEPAHLARVDAVARRCLSLGLAVILENPKDKQLMADPARHRERFLATVEQVAAHYRTWPTELMLEPMAEPHAALNHLWDRYFAEALSRIRRHDPGRFVLVGPPGYNAPEYLRHLELPPDPRLIVAVHIYTPAEFTLQGEAFIPGLRPPAGARWRGTRSERDAVAAAFDVAASWGRTHRRPVFVEEFGATERADLASRVRWLTWCRRLAEERGLSWGVWAFAPSFSVFDLARGDWHRPLLGALMPRRAAAPEERGGYTASRGARVLR